MVDDYELLLHLDGVLAESEIVEERSVAHLNIKVATPDGYSRVTHVCKTIPMRVWEINAGEFNLRGAGKHQIETASGLLCIDQLRVGDLVKTIDGLRILTRVYDTGVLENMFDIRVENKSHTFYSNGISSHNSTGLGSAEWLKQNMIPNYHWMYLAPMQQHVKTFTDRLEALQRDSAFTKKYLLSKGLRSNLNFKETPHGGSFKAMHVLNDPTKIRGNTARTVVVDECEVGSTIIAALGKSLVLTDLKMGSKILAYDGENNIRTDTVRRIVRKGIRQTWTIITRGGSQFTGTSNSRLRTPSGWRYVAEFVRADAAFICPVAWEIKTAQLRDAGHVAGDLTGRRVYADGGRYVSALSGQPQQQADGILSAQAGSTAGLHALQLGEECREPWLRSSLSGVRDDDDVGFRVYSLPVLHSGDGGDEGHTADGGESEVELGALEVDEIVSITYAGLQEVWDVETENHHTLFAGGIAVHNCQHFDAEFLPEITQVQKSFGTSKLTIFTGTATDLDTCLQGQFDISSQGIWYVKCSCPKKWHPMNDKESIFAMMSVNGLRCPESNQMLNPLEGRYVHHDDEALRLSQIGFHVPQVIVPQYASGDAWLEIWQDFKKFKPEKFLREVMGIATEASSSELTEADLKNCCGTHTFAEIQKQVLSGKRTYRYIFNGCDWGGSDWNPAAKTKLSYTVHTIYGLNADGNLELIHAHRYADAHYSEIAGLIASDFRKYRSYAMGTDEGGGQYYNAYIRDLGKIPPNLIASFKYGDPHDFMHRIEHPYWTMLSLHRTDSISALFEDIRNRKIIFPTWSESSGFVKDFLNCRRNFVEIPNTGRTVMRFQKPGNKSDDFMQSTNYASMMKRIVLRESTIPNAQLLNELNKILGVNSASLSNTSVRNNFGTGFSG